jgi:hypothetical protein
MQASVLLTGNSLVVWKEFCFAILGVLRVLAVNAKPLFHRQDAKDAKKRQGDYFGRGSAAPYY